MLALEMLRPRRTNNFIPKILPEKKQNGGERLLPLDDDSILWEEKGNNTYRSTAVSLIFVYIPTSH